MEHDGGAAGAHLAGAERAAAPAAGWGSGAGSAGVGDGDFGFDVIGERANVLDEGAGGIDGGGAEALAGAELLDIAGEQAGDFDHRVAILGESGHREGLDDGVVVGVLDGQGDGLVGVGGKAVVNLAQEDAIAFEFPAHHLGDQLAAAVACPGGGLGDLRVPEQVLAQLTFGDLVVVALFDLVDGEEALGGLGFLGDDAIVGLRIGVNGGNTAQATAAATTGRGQLGRRLVLRA